VIRRVTGRKVRGLLCVDPAFDGVAGNVMSSWLTLRSAPEAMRNLFDDQIEAGDHLRDRVLDLKARVHFDEIELAVLVEELDGSRRRDTHVGIAFETYRRSGALFGIERGRGGLFENLLVAALKRAVALAEMDRVAAAVAENLHLDVARLFEIFLDIDRVVAERRLGFRARGGEGLSI
jgi:hypothetical protein